MPNIGHQTPKKLLTPIFDRLVQFSDFLDTKSAPALKTQYSSDYQLFRRLFTKSQLAEIWKFVTFRYFGQHFLDLNELFLTSFKSRFEQCVKSYIESIFAHKRVNDAIDIGSWKFLRVDNFAMRKDFWRSINQIWKQMIIFAVHINRKCLTEWVRWNFL